MKLYAFQPNGHGQLSFFTMAESEEKAVKNVEALIAKREYDHEGWGQIITSLQ